MKVRHLAATVALTTPLCFPLYLVSRPNGNEIELRRTGGDFPGESDCSNSTCHDDGMANTGPGGVFVSINGMDSSEYRYTPGETVPVEVRVADPDQQRWGFQITARTEDGCGQAGAFGSEEDLVLIREDVAAPIPCTEAIIQFGVHTFPKAGGDSATFLLNWTAPPADIGPVVFAAAGNAANGNSQSSGDRIYTTQTTVAPSTAGVPPTPSINQGGIVAANLLPTVGVVSPNSIITVFGQDFAPEGTARDAGPDDLFGNQLPFELAGVCVEVDGLPAPMLSVRPTQLNLQVPSLDVQGPVSVGVISDCGAPGERRSDPEAVNMQFLSPAFFTKTFSDLDGRNPIAALHGGGPNEVGDPDTIAGATPAEPGEFVSLFATGLGLTIPLFEAGVVPQLADPENPTAEIPDRDNVDVTIGGIPLTPEDILYVGVAPCCAGLYQAVVKVPDQAPDGDLPVVISVDGISTPQGPFITVKSP